jgi:hypothetical protein
VISISKVSRRPEVNSIRRRAVRVAGAKGAYGGAQVRARPAP